LDRALAEDLARAADAARITPLVRALNQDPKYVSFYLNCGFQGIMVPNIASAAEARALADACRYPPQGRRGLDQSRSLGYGLNKASRSVLEEANENILVIALLEDISVMDELDEIVSTKGIDVFALGPSDMGNSMGRPGEYQHPELLKVLAKIEDAVKGASSIISHIVSTRAQIDETLAKGGQMISLNFNAVMADALRALKN
jgi:4-hydroxy-2-oxoheptanedioate aldolase